MVGHPVREIEPAEPMIGEVAMHLLAQAAFRTYAEQVPDQFGRSTCGGIVGEFGKAQIGRQVSRLDVNKGINAGPLPL